MNGYLSPELPRLRHIDVRPYSHNGYPHVALHDPLNLSDKMLLVPQPLAVVLSFCDGTRSAQEMATMFSSVYGIFIDQETVEGLLVALDSALLLDNARSREALAEASAQFRAQEFRPPFLAGQSYPATASALRAHLDAYVQRINRNGERANSSRPKIAGLLSPHIDYHRGGETYARVWCQAAEAVRDAELVIIFATDHYGDDIFTLTRQNYATPYGMLPTATDVVDELAAVLDVEQAYAGELRHGSEHSIELVVNWLHHMRHGESCDVVPILCGSYRHFTAQATDPGKDTSTSSSLARLLGVVRKQAAARKTLIVASGDMAHVGTAFGGQPLDNSKRAAVKSADEKLIRHMCTGNATAFLTEIQSISDANNVCGVSPIYLTMRTLGSIRGEITSYATCPADDTDTSAVTVTGVVFERTENIPS